MGVGDAKVCERGWEHDRSDQVINCSNPHAVLCSRLGGDFNLHPVTRT